MEPNRLKLPDGFEADLTFICGFDFRVETNWNSIETNWV
jgi:hypothetical protein